MRVTIHPSRAHGSVTAPPSKSVAHRALIAGAFSGGVLIDNVAYSVDIDATLSCLAALGARVEKGSNGPDGNVAIGGLALADIPDGATLDCRESGSTLRFLIPIAMLSGKTVHFTGSERLMQRPLGIYADLAARNGGVFALAGQTLTVCGGLSAGRYEIPGNISSQFITGLLFALSLADAPSEILVTGAFESSSYTDITVRVLRDFGVPVQRDDRRFLIPANSSADGSFAHLCRIHRYTVEGDCSNAAFLEALALLAGRTDASAQEDSLEVLGVPADTAQGDRVYCEMLHSLADGSCREFDLSDCPDLAPCMFAMAAYCGGAHFTGTARLAIKESDRASACAEELAKFGVAVTVGENDVTIGGAAIGGGAANAGSGAENAPALSLHAPTAVLSGHNDHRIVMAMALLCTVTGGTIDGAEAVAKSYPDFFAVIAAAGIALEWED